MLISVPARYQGADGALLRVKALAGIALKPSLCLIALASVPSPVFSRHLLKPAGMRSPHRACVLIIWLCFHMCRMSFSIASLSISVCPYSNKRLHLFSTFWDFLPGSVFRPQKREWKFSVLEDGPLLLGNFGFCVIGRRQFPAEKSSTVSNWKGFN